MTDRTDNGRGKPTRRCAQCGLDLLLVAEFWPIWRGHIIISRNCHLCLADRQGRRARK